MNVKLKFCSTTSNGPPPWPTLRRAARQIQAEPGVLVGLADLYGLYLKSQPKDAAAKALAVAVLDRAAQLKFASTSLWQRVADHYARLDQQKKAAAIYLRLLDQFPEASLMRDTLHEKLVGLYVQADDRTNAMKQLQAIVRDNPTHFAAGLVCPGGAGLPERQSLRGGRRLPQRAPLGPDHRAGLLRPGPGAAGPAPIQDGLRHPGAGARSFFQRSFAWEFYAGVVYAHVKNYSDAIRHFKEAEVIGLATDPSRLDQRFYFQFGAACERGRANQAGGGIPAKVRAARARIRRGAQLPGLHAGRPRPAIAPRPRLD